MASKQRPHIRRLLTCLLLPVLITIAASGKLDHLLDAAGLHTIAKVNQTYLQASSDKALKGFLTLSVLKVGLAVVEGSQVGVSVGVRASLQVGDVVQAAYDYVNLAWRTVLVGAIILRATTLLLDSAAAVDHWCLTITLSMVLALTLCVWIKPGAVRTIHVIRDAAAFLTILTISFYLLLPLSVMGGAQLSRTITQPGVHSADQGLTAIQQQLFPQQGFAEDQGYLTSLKDAKARIKEIAFYLKSESEEMVRWVIKIIAGYVFDTVIFPLAIFVLLVWLVKLITRYIFDIRNQRSLRQELESLFASYLGK